VCQAGVEAVVALMGAKLSATQKQLLQERFQRITPLLDGDATGRAASAQIAGELRPACVVRELFVAPGLQPDQMAPDQIRGVLACREGGWSEIT
jgi:DNA primase